MCWNEFGGASIPFRNVCKVNHIHLRNTLYEVNRSKEYPVKWACAMLRSISVSPRFDKMHWLERVPGGGCEDVTVTYIQTCFSRVCP